MYLGTVLLHVLPSLQVTCPVYPSQISINEKLGLSIAVVVPVETVFCDNRFCTRSFRAKARAAVYYRGYSTVCMVGGVDVAPRGVLFSCN
jgi:hypothetical protein